MNQRYLVALDQGTTSSRAIVFSLEGEVIAADARTFAQHYPQPGWVEHDPKDILSTQVEALRAAVRKAGIDPREIAAIGITNQRETTLLWDRDTGECLHPAIVWQCRRTAPLVDRLKGEGAGDTIRQKTGLVPDAYFSGTKLQWLLDHLGVRSRAEKGELCFGTVDSFLCWHLVQGHPHVTDATNAGRTMLFNLHTQTWDEELLRLMHIPPQVLPRVLDTAGQVGMLRTDILGVPVPVAALAGDQHAALFGQACYEEGQAKNTYGTGCFMLMNMGVHFRLSASNLLTTMAWRLKGRPTYALEGSVFVAGAAIQWLRDELKIIRTSNESEALARSVPDSGGVYFVPAFTGLGAPHWDMYARGTLVGLTRGTGAAHIARATLEAIAFQSDELLQAMARDVGRQPDVMRVDGGATRNNLLMQMQADLSAIVVQRPRTAETTALGAALLAGMGVGLFDSPLAAQSHWRAESEFQPLMEEEDRRRALRGWRRAVERAKGWALEENGEG
jgi:glycerol kinase